MNRIRLIILSCITISIGALLYAFVNELIILRFTGLKQAKHIIESTKKKVVLNYFIDDSWCDDAQEILWSNSLEKNILFLITHWLTLLRSEEIINKPVAIQSIICSPAHTDLYISFDRNILSKEFSTYKKWMIIEGLLKTLRINGITIPSVFFLSNHQPIQDTHLDFSCAWPLNGYLHSN